MGAGLRSRRLKSKWPPTAIPRLALGTPLIGESTFVQFDEEQREAARFLVTQSRVQLDGPPGSGKTHIAASLAIVCAIAGNRVLYLCPRLPLAEWMKWNLEMYGVAVKTIHGHMRDLLGRAGNATAQRQGYDDPDFFQAAREAVVRGAYDLVIGDEWQATSAQEQGFVRAVVGEANFLEVMDSSRDFRYSPPREIEPSTKVALNRTFRTAGLEQVVGCMAYGSGQESGTLEVSDGVRVSSNCGGGDLREELQSAVDGFLQEGFLPSEIGVVSCLPRARNASVDIAMRVLRPTGRLLRGPATSHGLVVDSGAYWLGLERKAIVVTEAPISLNHRETRLWNAVSRATKSVHVLLEGPVQSRLHSSSVPWTDLASPVETEAGMDALRRDVSNDEIDPGSAERPDARECHRKRDDATQGAEDAERLSGQPR